MAPDFNIIMRWCHFYWHSARDVALKMQIVSIFLFYRKN